MNDCSVIHSSDSIIFDGIKEYKNGSTVWLLILGKLQTPRQINTIAIPASFGTESCRVTRSYGRIGTSIDCKNQLKKSNIYEQRRNYGIWKSNQDNSMRIYGRGWFRNFDASQNCANLGRSDLRHAWHETGWFGSQGQFKVLDSQIIISD